MTINLTKSFFETIKSKTNIETLFILNYKNDYLIDIHGDIGNFKIFLDELADIIVKEGVDSEGELNSFGLSIERVIDDVLYHIGDKY